jgi:hypothetical protein
MRTSNFTSTRWGIALVAAPVVLFGLYIASIVVPVVVAQVVPAVVQAVTAN